MALGVYSVIKTDEYVICMHMSFLRLKLFHSWSATVCIRHYNGNGVTECLICKVNKGNSSTSNLIGQIWMFRKCLLVPLFIPFFLSNRKHVLTPIAKCSVPWFRK